MESRALRGLTDSEFGALVRLNDKLGTGVNDRNTALQYIVYSMYILITLTLGVYTHTTKCIHKGLG